MSNLFCCLISHSCPAILCYSLKTLPYLLPLPPADPSQQPRPGPVCQWVSGGQRGGGPTRQFNRALADHSDAKDPRFINEIVSYFSPSLTPLMTRFVHVCLWFLHKCTYVPASIIASKRNVGHPLTNSHQYSYRALFPTVLNFCFLCPVCMCNTSAWFFPHIHFQHIWSGIDLNIATIAVVLPSYCNYDK